MTSYLPFLVIGLVTGAVYGMAGIGLVLTYKTSGIFNFGYGAVAAFVVFIFYLLHVEQGLAWPWAALISVGVFAPLLGVMLELFARSLQGASETIKVAATIGLILIAESISLLWFPLTAPTFPYFLSQATVKILGVFVTWNEIIIFIVSLGASVALWWYFQSVRMGILMRGVVDNPELISMSGDDPIRIRRWAWIIGTVFCGIAGLMLAPGQPLTGITLPTIVFSAFGAAAIGLFGNLPLTFLGGLVIGIISAFADKYAARVHWMGGIPASLPFIVLFIVLIVTPPRRLAMRRFVRQLPVRRPYYAPAPIRLITGAVALGLLVVVPIIQKTHVAAWGGACVDIILFLSLGLLVRRSGQISLCQFTFAAVGAATFGHLASAHVPWLLALVLVMLIAVPVGAVVAIPAVRVSGVFLALATLGFALLVQGVFYVQNFMFTSTPVGIADPRPDVSIFGWHLYTENGFYYLLVVITVLVVAFYLSVNNGRLGRLLGAMADSPLALETQGATSSVLKVIVFCIAASMASLGGALYGTLYHYAGTTSFPPFNSIYIAAIIIIVTIGDPWFAVMGAWGYSVFGSYVQGSTLTAFLELGFGLAAVTAALGTRAGGFPKGLRALLDRWGGRTKPKLAVGAVTSTGGALITGPPEAPTRSVAAVTATQTGLVVNELTVVFGGVRAVSGVSLEAPSGRITGLIGPNGAGKTTTFNACSGLNRPTSGGITLHGRTVSHMRPSRRARLGLGRTFQRPELFDNLTVRQNVAIGCEAPMAGGNPLTQVVGSRRANQTIKAVVAEAMSLASITGIADVQVGLLPIGQRRLVELARVVAGSFDLLLLDEPSSGLDGRETEHFGEILRAVVAQRGCGILLVEHDMVLVRAVCDYVYVLDFGEMIFEGMPQEMMASDTVRAAYLGDVAAATAGVAATSPRGGFPG